MNKAEIALPNRERLALAGGAVEVRSEEETKVILTWLAQMGDDPAKLMRRVLFEMKGRVWGESLFVAKKGQLALMGEVLGVLGRISVTDEVRLPFLVFDQCMGLMVENSHDIYLYLVMARDLGGDKAAEEILKYLRLTGVTDAELKQQEGLARDYYLATAGRNVWEWEDKLVYMFFPTLYANWQKALRDYPLKSDEETRRALASSLKEQRSRLSEHARVLISRGIVDERTVISGGSFRVSYKEIEGLLFS